MEEDGGGRGGVVIQRRISLSDRLSADRRESLAGLTLNTILTDKRHPPPKEGGGGGGDGDVLRGRISLSDQMSADRPETLAGLTLNALLAADKRPPPPPTTPTTHKTLLDVIRDEDPNNNRTFAQKDRKSWKIFRASLKLKRAGAALTSSVHTPTSDVSIENNNTSPVNSSTDNCTASSRQVNHPEFSSRGSVQLGATESTRSNHLPDFAMVDGPPPIRNSTSIPDSEANEHFELVRDGTRRLAAILAEERSLSERETAETEAAAAAEAEATAATEEEEAVAEDGGGQVRMSLMDLLEETEREMGLECGGYIMDDEEVEMVEEEEAVEVKHSCCVCMVRHKGAAFIPCGHTFCRLCSRELFVQRGNCPICNGLILEILDIF